MVVGVHRRGRARSVASVAMTSLAFMFVDVPEPVWNTSIGNCVVVLAARRPRRRRRAIAVGDVRGRARPSSALTVAAAALDPGQRADLRALDAACRRSGSSRTARWVWARHRRRAGTRTSPIESCSMRKSLLGPRVLSQRGAAVLPAGSPGLTDDKQRPRRSMSPPRPLSHATAAAFPRPAARPPARPPWSPPVPPPSSSPCGSPCPAAPSAISPLGSPVPPSRPRPGTGSYPVTDPVPERA